MHFRELLRPTTSTKKPIFTPEIKVNFYQTAAAPLHNLFPKPTASINTFSDHNKNTIPTVIHVSLSLSLSLMMMSLSVKQQGQVLTSYDKPQPKKKNSKYFYGNCIEVNIEVGKKLAAHIDAWLLIWSL